MCWCHGTEALEHGGLRERRYGGQHGGQHDAEHWQVQPGQTRLAGAPADEAVCISVLIVGASAMARSTMEGGLHLSEAVTMNCNSRNAGLHHDRSNMVLDSRLVQRRQQLPGTPGGRPSQPRGGKPREPPGGTLPLG